LGELCTLENLERIAEQLPAEKFSRHYQHVGATNTYLNHSLYQPQPSSHGFWAVPTSKRISTPVSQMHQNFGIQKAKLSIDQAEA
jgi:hypothetical protein